MIKDILVDILAHTHSLGFLNLLKITGSDTNTLIESIEDKQKVIMYANTKHPVDEFKGVIGLPNLDKLNFLLKNPQYQENATIKVVEGERNGKVRPTEIHFENEAGDFQNDYRFMNAELINERLAGFDFEEPKWDIVIDPAMLAIQKLKLQASANTDENVFRVKTENGNLVFYFGDLSTHAGSFVFHADIKGKLKNSWCWPIAEVVSILNLDGKITMKISDGGLMQIVVDSGIADYSYNLPGMSK